MARERTIETVTLEGKFVCLEGGLCKLKYYVYVYVGQLDRVAGIASLPVLVLSMLPPYCRCRANFRRKLNCIVKLLDK